MIPWLSISPEILMPREELFQEMRMLGIGVAIGIVLGVCLKLAIDDILRWVDARYASKKEEHP